VAALIHAASSKATPADADEFGYVDSAAGAWSLVKITWANLKTAILTLVAFLAPGIGAVLRPLLNKLRDQYETPLDYGGVGDGVANDTAAIVACATANQGKRWRIPAGTWRYAGGAPDLAAGTVVMGDGRYATRIVSISAAPTALFSCMGYGSGVESMGFQAETTQTGGMYVYLGGIESYIEDFYMTGDYRGVVMYGNVAQIRHGHFLSAATNGIRIDTGGGDNSQTISNVIMGAQSPANVAEAGIRVRNSVSLTIDNVSIIQQGKGLLIDPTAASGPVLNLIASNCYFDNCTYPIYVNPNGGTVRRLTFINCWASSGNAGLTLIASGGATIKGVRCYNLQANLNSGAGVNVGGVNVSQLSFIGGNVSGNAYGFYFNNGIPDVRISDMDIGAYDDFSGNATSGITFAGSGYTKVRITDNKIVGNGTSIQNENLLGSGSVVARNEGASGSTAAITVGASPFTYTAASRPETVYVRGGTVSSVTVEGVQVHAQSNVSFQLRPGASAVVTYSAAPTMNKTISD